MTWRDWPTTGWVEGRILPSEQLRRFLRHRQGIVDEVVAACGFVSTDPARTANVTAWPMLKTELQNGAVVEFPYAQVLCTATGADQGQFNVKVSRAC